MTIQTNKNDGVETRKKFVYRYNSNPHNRDFTTQITGMTIGDKNALHLLMADELNLYNSLAEYLSASSNRDPSTLASLGKKEIELFGQLCGDGITITQAKELPDYNKEFLNTIKENVAILFEIAKKPARITKNTRKNLGTEVMKFFVHQAQAKKNSKVATQSLEQYTLIQKRHVQVPREDCKIVYDEANNTTTIYISYLSTPIAVLNNYDGRNAPWNLVIVHQQPTIIPTSSTDWFAEFKTLPVSYNIKYLDRVSANSPAFHNKGKNFKKDEGKKSKFWGRK